MPRRVRWRGVALTPEGRRREDTLQLTSPAGTTRTSVYISPTNADFSPGNEEDVKEERELERFCRHGVVSRRLLANSAASSEALAFQAQRESSSRATLQAHV